MSDEQTPVPETNDAEFDEVAALREALTERDQQLAGQADASRAALERLKAALLASEPALDPAMVQGDTVEAVEQSFADATKLLRRVRDEVRRELAVQVPAGAPGRSGFRPRTPFDKIRHGLAED